MDYSNGMTDIYGSSQGGQQQGIDIMSNFGNTTSSMATPYNGTTNQLDFWDKGGALDTGMGTFGKMAGGVSSLANVYLGFQNLDMAKEKMGIYREQWDMAKQELKHMQGTRAAITKQFSGK